MASAEVMQGAIAALRNYSPRLENAEFAMNPNFVRDFERVKAPLISYLTDKVEEALRTVPENITDDFLKGFVDGTICMIQLLAETHLTESSEQRS